MGQVGLPDLKDMLCVSYSPNLPTLHYHTASRSSSRVIETHVRWIFYWILPKTMVY